MLSPFCIISGKIIVQALHLNKNRRTYYQSLVYFVFQSYLGKKTLKSQLLTITILE